jgi:pantothenate kinase
VDWPHHIYGCHLSLHSWIKPNRYRKILLSNLHLRYIRGMSIELLFEQIQSLLNGQSPRSLIGIVGKPGAGKSTVVEQIKNRFRSNEVSIIPMDGFHLSNVH